MVTILTTVIREATKHLNSRSERLLFSLSPLRSLSRSNSARDERAPLNSAQKNWANMSETPSDNKGREERAKKPGQKRVMDWIIGYLSPPLFSADEVTTNEAEQRAKAPFSTLLGRRFFSIL